MPVRNGAGSLELLLHSLHAQTLASERFEVIVVDNASSDTTGTVASRGGARVVYEPVPNRALARNRGVAAARSTLYAFVDADCAAQPRWLESLLGCRSLAPLVAGEVRLRTSEDPNPIERLEALWRFGQASWVHQGWASAANLLVHAEAFDAVGGFDHAYRHYSEDADFCLRAGRAGYRLDYCGDAVVEHRGECEWRPFLRRFFMHGYGSAQAYYRIGAGYRAWRAPRPALIGDAALRDFGCSPNAFDPGEWRRMARLARLGYAARVAGSVWAELLRAR